MKPTHPLLKSLGCFITKNKAKNGCYCHACNEYFKTHDGIISHYEVVVWNGPHPLKNIFN